MTSQTATYGMDYLRHADVKDVLMWIRMNVDILPDVGSKISKLFNHNGTLTIPCHQFAASVIGRLMGLQLPLGQEYIKFFYQNGRLILIADMEGWNSYMNLPINPFHGMTMPDGSPRTSCTREEFDEWKKDLE